MSSFDIRVIPASYKEVGSVPCSSEFWKSLWRIGINCSFSVWCSFLYSLYLNHFLFAFCIWQIYDLYYFPIFKVAFWMIRLEVPAVVQQDWWRLCSTRTQVWFLAQQSGLKDPVLLQPQSRWQLWFGSDPWPGNSICCRAAKKGGKKIRFSISL